MLASCLIRVLPFAVYIKYYDTLLIGCVRIKIVDEHHTMTDEHLIFNLHSRTNKRM
jgi:hypothetical protein